jgi:hypothetical protein
MKDDHEKMTMDEPEGPQRDDLSRLLGLWKAPDAPETLDNRILASFREQAERGSIWRRFFTASIRVPVPVALAAALLLLLSVGLALRRPTTAVPEASRLGPPVQAADAQAPPVVTHTSLAGFEPANDVDASIVLESALQ